MPRKVKPVPTGFRTVTPYLVVRNAIDALSFYETAFGASVVSKHMDETGQVVAHAEMKIGNAIVMICDEVPEWGLLSPAALGGTPIAMHLYLADLDDAWSRVTETDAAVLVPMHDTVVGERFGKIVDPFGHVWTLAQRIALPAFDKNVPESLLTDAANDVPVVEAPVQETVVADVLVEEKINLVEETVNDEPVAELPTDEVAA